MIKENCAFKAFEINLERTNMLIQAVDKIGGYNYQYQDKAYDINPEYGNIVKSVQDIELEKISISCFEHAIISLATTFETYLKELIQELLFKYSDYFLKHDTKWKEKIKEIINDSEGYDFEFILDKLNLKNRFQIIDFLSKHNVFLLSTDLEKLIKSIYIKRNNFVHSGSKLSEKAKSQIKDLISVDKKTFFDLSIKQIRTKFKRLMNKTHENVLGTLENK